MRKIELFKITTIIGLLAVLFPEPSSAFWKIKEDKKYNIGINIPDKDLIVLKLLESNDALLETNHLKLEGAYNTDISLYRDYLIDEDSIYYTKGYAENNFFEKINLLTGQRKKVAALASRNQFNVIASSDDYLVSNSGNKISVYNKDDGKLLKNTSIKDNILASVLDEEVLYLIQETINNDITLNSFSVPSLKLIKTQIFDVKYAKFKFLNGAILAYQSGSITEFDYKGNLKRQLMCGDKCRGDFREVNERYVFVTRSNLVVSGTDYFDVGSIFDLKKFEFLSGEMTSRKNMGFSFVFIKGNAVYCFMNPIYYSNISRYDVDIFALDSGKKIGSLEGLSGYDMNLLQVKDHVVILYYPISYGDSRVNANKSAVTYH